MKKLIFLFAVMAFSASASFAQLPISLGAKVGWNSTSLTTDTKVSDVSLNSFDPRNSNGFIIGGFARLNFWEKLYIQPELYYNSSKGKTEVTADNGIAYEQEMKLKNVNIPLLFGYKLLDFKVASVNALTGPVAIFPTSGTSVSFDSSEGISGAVPNDWDDLTGAQWGWQLGAGIDFAMLSLDVRYEWALTDYSKKNTDQNFNFDSFDSKTNMLTVALGFRIL